MLNQIDLSRIDLNLLVLFEVVLTERHVGRAAERLHLSPSAVSHGLKRLRTLFNDPLFLRTPKGVVPSERAMQLSGPIAEVLARISTVVAMSEPFNPTTSNRRFTIAAPDAISAVVLPPLLATIRLAAPLIDIAIRQLLPVQAAVSPERVWQPALVDLETRAVDIVMAPIQDIPTRFAHHLLYQEEFVIAARSGHPYLQSPSLIRFCSMSHLLVSLTGDPHGFVDQSLAEHGLQRRIELTVPNFMMALSTLAETDLIAALPKQLVVSQAERFGVAAVEPPLPLRRDNINLLASKAALMDEGVAWLFDEIRGLNLVY